MTLKRVVVTGMGALTPLGNDVNSFWNNAIEGKSGATAVTRFDVSAFKTQFACQLQGFDASTLIDRKEARKLDPYMQYAIFAADEALNDCGLDLKQIDPFDIGVIWGTGQAGFSTFEEEVTAFVKGDGTPRFNPFFIPKVIANMASGMISLRYGLMGINHTAVSACASTNSAMMDAFNYIRLGKANAFVVGGSDSPVTGGTFGGFNALKALSTRNNSPETASRPFDVDRDGFVIGEGAGALILEDYDHAKARGAKIYAELVGAASTADAYHMTASHPEGLGASRALELALEEAQLNPDDVDYINAHGTSTPVGDVNEIRSITNVFGDSAKNTFISSTKSMTGHLLGAAGAIEAILSIKVINEGIIPPTINLENLDPAIPSTLKIVANQAISTSVNVALSNSFGFGGHNTVVVFRKV